MKLTEVKLKQIILEIMENQEIHESLDSMMARHDFKPYDNSWIKKPTKHKNYSHRSWFKGEPGRRGTVRFDLEYTLHNSVLHYKIEALSKRKRRNGKRFSIAQNKIEVPPSLSLETEQGIGKADALMLSNSNAFTGNKEVETIERALGMYE